jgi:hypothetical protein
VSPGGLLNADSFSLSLTNRRITSGQDNRGDPYGCEGEHTGLSRQVCGISDVCRYGRLIKPSEHRIEGAVGDDTGHRLPEVHRR